jgi:uncharacterized protein involved in exopolysaccharide biosynthesis
MDTSKNRSELEQIKDLIVLCLRNWYCFVISFFVCGALAVLYLAVKTPVLQVLAQVSLRHDESLLSGGGSQSQSLMSAFGMGGEKENIEDETIRMASEGNIRSVVKNLELNKVYQQIKCLGFSKTNLYNQSPVIISADPAIADTIVKKLLFTVNLNKEGSAKVKLKINRKTIGKYEISSFPANIETPYGAFIFSKSSFYDGYEKPLTLKILFTNYDYMAQVYMGILDIDFEKKTSDIINLGIVSENVPLAKRILTEVIDVYNKTWKQDKDDVNTKTIEYLDERLQYVKESLSFADKKIEAFKNTNKITDMEANVSNYLISDAKFDMDAFETEIQLNLLGIIRDFLKDEKNKYSLIPFDPATANNTSVSDMVVLYNENMIRRNELFKSSGLSKMAVDLDNQIQLQRENLLKSIENFEDGMQITLKNLKKKSKENANLLGKVPAVEVDYLHLRREQEIQQSIYTLLIEKREETGIKAVSLLPKLKLINQPYMINKPVSPSLMKIALATLFFGGVVFPLTAIYGRPYFKILRKRKNK